MKKIILAFTATAMAAIAAISNTNAQNTQSAAGIATISEATSSESTVSVVATAESKEFTNSMTESKVSLRALKDFNSTYSAYSNATWYKADDGGFVADFTNDGIKNAVAYDPKGRWNHTILYYGEKNLPKDVRNEVKSSYYDFNITGAEEIHVENEVVYLVNIQDDATCKIIRVSGDNMDEIQSLDKP